MSHPTSLQVELVVETDARHAFDVFTQRIDSWWNADHHIIEAPFDHMVFEPRVGGHVYDVGTDGSECRWSRVLVHEPPQRVVFTWDITPSWELETDPERCSEIEVTFAEEQPGRTRVRLEHRHLDRHGDGWEQMVGAMATAGGWQGELDAYADAVRRR